MINVAVESDSIYAHHLTERPGDFHLRLEAVVLVVGDGDRRNGNPVWRAYFTDQVSQLALRQVMLLAEAPNDGARQSRAGKRIVVGLMLLLFNVQGDLLSVTDDCSARC